MHSFILKFKEIRKNLSLTQVQFANKLDVSRSAIAQIEMGKNTPTTDLLLKIIDTFSLTPNYLFGFSDDGTNLVDKSDFDIIEFYKLHEDFNTLHLSFCAMSLMIYENGGKNTFVNHVKEYEYLTLEKSELFRYSEKNNFKNDLINRLQSAKTNMINYVHTSTFNLYSILKSDDEFFNAQKKFKRLN